MYRNFNNHERLKNIYHHEDTKNTKLIKKLIILPFLRDLRAFVVKIVA